MKLSLPHRSPLRVALVASSLRIGGAEKQTFYLARALVQAQAQVRLFHLGHGGHFEGLLDQAGIPVENVYQPGQSARTLWQLLRGVRRFRPHVVWVAQFGDAHYGAIAGRLCRGLTLAGIRSDGYYELGLFGRASRWLVPWLDGLVANSQRARQNLAAAGLRADQIDLLPNVIDLEDYDARAAQDLAVDWPADRVVLAAVGSLQPCKRFERFLEALALARQSAPNLFGVLAGSDRGCRPALETRARALGLLPGHFRFLGECTQVPALLTRADGLVLCSEYEGFPNVILEAMAARLPVITTPVGDAAEIVQPETTGWVVPEEDRTAMADCMVRLAHSPQLGIQLGEAGRRRLEQAYSFGTLPARLCQLLNTIARRQARRPLRRCWSQAQSVLQLSGARAFAAAAPAGELVSL